MLSDDNVVPLHYLSKIYEVESLKKKTKKYIDQHHQDLFTKILLYDPQNKLFNITEIEEYIGKSLLYYITKEEDNLISLPISSLHHILSIYNETKSNKEEEKDEIIKFLFKCLDKKGRSASVLFSKIKIDKNTSHHINHLVDKYSNQFDFNFVNAQLCHAIVEQSKTIESLQKELNKKNLLLDCFMPTIKFLDHSDMINKCRQLRKDVDEGKITYVEFPSGLKEIPPFSFYKCSNLKKIKIPSSVITIDSHAFSFCSFLEEVIFDENSSLLHIRHYGFGWCESLEKIEIPDSVVSFDYRCFHQCIKLKRINIPSNLMFIGDFAFENCNMLLTPIELPLTVNYVGSFAFSNCTKLKTLNVKSPNTYFECYAFFKCTNLESIQFADSTRHIHLNCFNGCNGLKTIRLPDSTEIIDGGAFWNCVNLKDINVPNQLSGLNHMLSQIAQDFQTILSQKYHHLLSFQLMLFKKRVLWFLFISINID